ncbi:MAG TPA: HAD-IA family hydrolase [Spirochaetota bacterium]|nr:HAD-IA family hydrolase [Spirochaetota bacterium]
MTDAIIFDMDGVLIDSKPLHYETDIAILKQIGLEKESSYLDRFVGMTNPEMWQQIADENKLDINIEDILNTQIMLKLELLWKQNFSAIDGVVDLIRKIYSNNTVIGVASSSSEIFIENVLKKIDIGKYITSYVSGENVPKGKPAPDIYIHIADVLGVKPAKCIAIEDSYHGVVAAKRAGMKVVGYKNVNSGNQDLSLADMVIDDFVKLALRYNDGFEMFD